MNSLVQKPFNNELCFYPWMMKPSIYTVIKGLADEKRFRKTWENRWYSVGVVTGMLRFSGREILLISLAYT